MKAIQRCLWISLLLSAASLASAQQLLHNNGRWETGVQGTNRVSMVPFPDYDTWGIVNNGFSTTRQRVADNFVVTDPNGWQLSHAIWYAYQSGSQPANPFSQAYVGIYTVNPIGTSDLTPAYGSVDPNTAPNRLVAQSPTNVFRVRSDNPTQTTRPIYALQLDLSWVPPLPPGEYWLAVGLRGSTGTSAVAAIGTLPVPANGNAICMGRNRGAGCGSPNPELTTWTCADGEISDACADCDTYEMGFEIWGTGSASIGACCFVDGVCIRLAQDVCAGQSGLFQGVGSACDPNPCPLPPGACCFADTGACQSLTAADCLSASGNFQGILTTCDPNPCPQPTGACCLPTGQCLPDFEQPACTAIGGEYAGNNVACEPASAGDTILLAGQPNAAIPDGDLNGLTETQVFLTHLPVHDVNVTLNIPDHTYIGDLQITLRHLERNISITFWNRACNDSAFTGLTATFDDDGGPVMCDSPTTGVLDAELDAFEGIDAFGTWTLIVKDLAGGDVGTLVSYSIEITAAGPSATCSPAVCAGDVNCDGVVDFADIDLFVEALSYPGGNGWPYLECPWLSADCNGDADVNFADIDVFVERIGAVCP